VTATTAAAAPPRRALRVPGVRLLREIARRPAGAFGLSVVGALVVLATFGPTIAPRNPDSIDILSRLSGPSAHHLLGTDQLGRDLLSRLIDGARIALEVAVPAVLCALAIGILLGLLAGYAGGIVDNALIVVLDTMQAFPWVVLALALITLLGPSLTNLVLVLTVGFIPPYARVTRALVLSITKNPYVEAERALGASPFRVGFFHVVPNLLAPLTVLAAMDLPSAIAGEAGLSFLGLGVAQPTPSWGNILNDGFTYVRESPWAVLWPGLTLMIVTLALTLLAETARDIVDPTLSGTRRGRRVRV
jgi:peptide/nickel transport system permease protein